MTDTRRFNRDYVYVTRLAKRVKYQPEELLLQDVRQRLESIVHHWSERRANLTGKALRLLSVDTTGLKPQIGRMALVSLHLQSGERIKVLCVVLARVALFNRFEVAPVNGEGRMRVSASSLAFVD
jgi:hypothetical protein